jgi:hypothetical protein
MNPFKESLKLHEKLKGKLSVESKIKIPATDSKEFFELNKTLFYEKAFAF